MSEQATRYEAVIDGMLYDRTVGYHPDMAIALGSIKDAVCLMQLIWWNGNPTTVKRGGWFYKTYDDFHKETGASKAEQISARKFLAKHNLIETKLDYPQFETRDGQTRTLWHKVNWYKVNMEQVRRVLMVYYATGKTLGRRKPGNRKASNQKRVKGKFVKAE